MKADPNCEDCGGSGEIETEGLDIGRPYYSKQAGRIVTPMRGKGDWRMTPCHCLEEENAE